jgi:hypothetical protein
MRNITNREQIAKYEQQYGCRAVYVNNFDYPTESLTDTAESNRFNPLLDCVATAPVHLKPLKLF